MARLLKEVVFEGAAWGCIAEQDPVSRRFRSPLTITGVRPNSEAAAFGLRAGDQIVSWSKNMSGAPDYKAAIRTESCVRSAAGLSWRPSYYVDEETQQMLCQGGACRMRVRLVPRCSTPRCPGTIIENADSFDHSLVCDECGVQAVSPRVYLRFCFRFRCACAIIPARMHNPCIFSCLSVCARACILTQHQTPALIDDDSGRRLAHL